MRYRAKITEIQSWVSKFFIHYEKRIVRDANEVYIEVDSEYTADQLEQLNKIKDKERSLKVNIIAYCEDRLVYPLY